MKIMQMPSDDVNTVVLGATSDTWRALMPYAVASGIDATAQATMRGAAVGRGERTVQIALPRHAAVEVLRIVNSTPGRKGQ